MHRVTDALGLAEGLHNLVDRAYGECDDDRCLVFFGVVRDCAYAIRSAGGEPALRRMIAEADRGSPVEIRMPDKPAAPWGETPNHE